MWKRLVAGLLALVSLGAWAQVSLAAAPPAATSAAATTWLAVWGAPPTPPTIEPGGRFEPSPHFTNQTLRQVVRISAGGKQVRIRISNEYSAAPLHIGAAHIGLTADGSAIQPGSDHALTFGGRPDAVIPPGAPLLSDPVDMAVEPLASLTVSLYFPTDSGPCVCHMIGAQTGYTGRGDVAGAQIFPGGGQTYTYRAFLTGVEVATPLPARGVVVLGDSLSDGTMSTPDTNHRWPDILAERLAARDKGKFAWGVVDASISGNRLLVDGSERKFNAVGQNALRRFDRDVLSAPGMSVMVVYLGINDLGYAYGLPAVANAAPVPTAESLIAGYRQLIDRAHAHGLKVYGVTLTPFEGAAYYTAKGEALRQEINTWIRTGKAYDGVIDFDAAWRDPDHPGRIKEGLHAVDHLHGSDTGYSVLGYAVDLKLFN